LGVGLPLLRAGGAPDISAAGKGSKRVKL
jgi:hypothetical protein